MSRKKKITSSNVNEHQLNNLLEEFQNWNKSKGLSKASLTNYEYTINSFISFIDEKSIVHEICERTVISYITTLRAKEMRATSINHHLRHLRAFFYWCMKNGYVEEFSIKLVREQETVKETYSDDELRLLLREPAKSASYVEWRSWTVINWLLDNGNRAETVCSVRMRDFSLDRQDVILAHTKSRKAQILPISDDLAMVLRKFIRMFRAEAGEDDFLFASVDGNKMTVNSLKLSIRKYNQTRGVEKSGVHMFRHTFAKMMIMNDCNAFRLQRMLGHSTLEMTRRYVNLYGQDLKENHEKYSPLHRINQGKGIKHIIKRNRRGG